MEPVECVYFHIVLPLVDLVDLVEEVNVIAVVTLPFPSSSLCFFLSFLIFHVVTSTYFSVKILLEKIQM